MFEPRMIQTLSDHTLRNIEIPVVKYQNHELKLSTALRFDDYSLLGINEQRACPLFSKWKTQQSIIANGFLSSWKSSVLTANVRNVFQENN